MHQLEPTEKFPEKAKIVFKNLPTFVENVK